MGFAPLINCLWQVKIERAFQQRVLEIYFSLKHFPDTPEHYWCKVPELNNLTVDERKFLSIPVVDVSIFGKIL